MTNYVGSDCLGSRVSLPTVFPTRQLINDGYAATNVTFAFLIAGCGPFARQRICPHTDP